MGVSLEGILSFWYRQEREKLEVDHKKILSVKLPACLSDSRKVLLYKNKS